MKQRVRVQENSLCDALQKQHAVYQQLLTQLADITGNVAGAPSILEGSRQLEITMQSVVAQESQFQQLMTTRRQSEQPASSRLRKCTNDVRGALQMLIAKVDETVEQYKQLKNHMLPRMDEVTRKREAVKSYQRLSGEY